MQNRLFNKQAEQAFVGCLILNPSEIISYRTNIKTNDFYLEVCRVAYETLCKLVDAGETPSELLVLEKSGLDPVQIGELLSASAMPFELDGLAKVIKEYSKKRMFGKMVQDVSKRLQDDTSSEDIAVYVDTVLADMRKDNTAKWISNRDLLMQHIATIEQRYEAGGVIGVSTGFTDLDEKLGGLVPGNLIMLAAVPKAGKTSFALHMGMNSSVNTLFFTLEMLPEELMDRQLAITSKISSKSSRTGKMSDTDWKNLSTGITKVQKIPLSFVWQSGLSVGEIRAICLQYKQQHDLGLVIIDQLDKIYEPGTRGENLAVKIGRVTTGLKNIARDLDVPVVCLCQLLDKRIASRDTKRPQHGDIRDSSYPDQDADIVLYLWRPSMYDPQNVKYQNLVEVIIARSRATAEGSVWVRWVPQYTEFTLLDKNFWPGGVAG